MKQAYDYETIQLLVLKGVLLNQSLIPRVSEIISSEDFKNLKYRAIYEAILDLFTQVDKIDKANLFEYLKYNKDITLLETDLSLFMQPPLESPVTLARILQKRAVEYNSLEILRDSIVEIGEKGDSLSVLGTTITRLGEQSLKLTTKDEKSFEETVLELGETIVSGGEEDVFYVPTPYQQLNKYIRGGFREGQLVTIGARTGVGKTVVATNCAAEACHAGKSVLFFSLEMSKSELIKRMIASHGDIMLKYLDANIEKNDQTKEKIKKTAEEISKWKLNIKDDSDVTLEHIKAIAQQQSDTEDGLDMIVIDYLQLISTRGLRGGNRQEQVAEISRTCKTLARDLGVPIMVLVQLNRETKDDENRIPSKADIRESGAIAADSDIILILHRKYRDDSPEPKALFILDKNRGGQADRMFNMRSVLEKNLFLDLIDDGKDELEEFGSEEDVIDENNDLDIDDLW